MHTCPEFVELYFAIAMCGAVIVPINARYKAAEIGYVIENADLVTVLTTAAIAEQVDFVERLESALPGLVTQPDPKRVALAAAPRLRSVVRFGAGERAGFVSEAAFDAAADTVPEIAVHETRLGVRVRDVALMLYTSGTTANPKGCLITHEAQVRNSITLGRHRYRLTEADSLWSPLPMFHIAAVLPMLAIFDVGGTYLTMGYFDPGVALRMLEEHKVTATYPSFVTIMQGLIYHPDFASRDLTHIRLMNSNFAVQPPGVAEPIMKAMPSAVQVGSFGMTEASGTVSTGSPSEPESQRITRLGRLLRPTRLDELPQLINVLRGEMSLIGPRPERPQLEIELEHAIPHYRKRHWMPPGLSGWAQVCAPYAASVEEAELKLSYDLYYLRHWSTALDLLILAKTIKTVLKGAGR